MYIWLQSNTFERFRHETVIWFRGRKYIHALQSLSKLTLLEDHISNQRDATFYALYWLQHSTCFGRHTPIVRSSGTALGPPVCTHNVTKTERLPTKEKRSRNPQPINIHIILYDINHNPIDKIVLPIIT